MSINLHAEILSPERALFRGEAVSVTLRSGGGDIAFLANHSPFIGSVEICVCKLQFDDGSERRFAIHGGFVSVSKNVVRVLAGVAEADHDIDVARARAALDRSSAHQVGEAPSDELRRAQVRLEAASK